MKRLFAFAAISAFTTSAFCAPVTNDSRDTGSSIIVGGGPSIPMLGSWERRAAAELGYSMWRPEPRLGRKLGGHLDAVWTFYGMYDLSRDGRYDLDPTWSGGFTFGYRKTWADSAGRGFAYQLYWGGIYGDRGTHDLPSELNSTPGMTFSWLHPLGARNIDVNLQYMHISNAGTVAPNRGQNFFLLTLEFPIHG